MRIKKGLSLVDLAILSAIAITIVIFFGIWIFGMNVVTETMLAVESTPGAPFNISEITQDTLGNVNSGYSLLRLISLLMIFGFSLSILISSFIEKQHPGLGFVVHFFVLILSVIFSMYISNSYEALLVDPVIGATLQSFTGSTFIILNLPIWITVIGFIGMILLFSGIPKDPSLGGGVTR